MSWFKQRMYYKLQAIMNFPWITYSALGICILVFLWEIPYLSSYSNPIVENYAVNSSMVFSMKQYYRLITAGFVHLSWSHIIMNGYSLYILGPEVERAMGHGKYFALLICSIIIGNLAVCILAPYTSAAGISTGLYGLMVYVIARIAVNNGIHAIIEDSGIRWTILVNLIMNFQPGISWQGHLGGAITGLVFAILGA